MVLPSQGVYGLYLLLPVATVCQKKNIGAIKMDAMPIIPPKRRNETIQVKLKRAMK